MKGAEKCWLFYRYTGRGNFQRLEMTCGSGDSEQTREECLFSASFKPAPGAHYYLVAESDKSAALSPARASCEFHVVK